MGIAEYTNPTFRMVEAKNGISYYPQDPFVCPKIPGPKNLEFVIVGMGLGPSNLRKIAKGMDP